MPPLDRASLSTALLADVLDAMGCTTSALPTEIRPLREGWRILGQVATLSAVTVASVPSSPYEVEMACIDALRSGEILVATTNGDRGSALWGELLSTACKARGATGVVLDGLTRDASQILAMDFPVFAAGFCPLDSKGRLDCIAHGVPIRVGQCVIRPGDWIAGDIDGLIVVPAERAEEAFQLALEKAAGENRVREELARGRSVRKVFAEYGIL